MKKLLSLLSVLTISGSAVPTTIAASPYQKEKTIKNSNNNYSQTNNLEKLNRSKRSKVIMWNEKNNLGGAKQERLKDSVENEYCFLCHNYLTLKIDNVELTEIFFFEEIHPNDKDALWNKIFITINNFKKENHSADNQNDDYISNSDISTIVDVMVKHFQEIRNVFKKNTKKGLIIRTNRVGAWTEDYYKFGVYLENNPW